MLDVRWGRRMNVGTALYLTLYLLIQGVFIYFFRYLWRVNVCSVILLKRLMKVALCQTKMYWTIEENLENILHQLTLAASAEADLAVFPECALTGYHRKVPEITKAVALESAFKRIKAHCIEQQISAIVGSPFIPGSEPESIYNSAICFTSAGKQPEITSKIGLTAPELRFFTKADQRHSFRIGNRRIGIFFCCEVRDKDELIADFSLSDPDLLIWPSYIAWDGEPDPDGTTGADYIRNAEKISAALGIPVINVNAANGVNRNNLSGLGGSVFINMGEVMFQLPKDQELMELIET